MDHDITKSGPEGLIGPAGENQKGRGHGHYFPEEIEGDQVTGKDRPQGAADIEQGADMLGIISEVKSVDKGGKCIKGKNRN